MVNTLIFSKKIKLTKLRNKQMHKKLNLRYLRMRTRFKRNGELHHNH